MPWSPIPGHRHNFYFTFSVSRCHWYYTQYILVQSYKFWFKEYWQVKLSELPQESKNTVLNSWVPWVHRHDKNNYIYSLHWKLGIWYCLTSLAQRRDSEGKENNLNRKKEEEICTEFVTTDENEWTHFKTIQYMLG